MALSAGDTLLNRHYSIIRQLGRGGFGFVYLAQDALLGEQVAIKELIPALVGDETMLKRFLAEARATLRLRQERIVGTHNVFREGGNYYIVMECMAGGSLEESLQAHGPLPVDKAVQVAVEVCEGLAYAHERGVIHCDLKPANILFDKDGHAKVADFGIAHVSGEMLTRTWKTPQGLVAGTLPYMSPEQADGVRNDPRIDVYAVGAVLYRMLTGRPYLDFDQRETPGAQADNVYRIRNQEAKPPSTDNRHVPVWLDAVVLKALAKQPKERYASAGDLRAELLLRRRPQPISSSTPPQTSKTVSLATPALALRKEADRNQRTPARQRALPRWLWLLAGVTAILLLAIVIGITALLDKNNGNQPTVTPQPSQIMAAIATATLVPPQTDTVTPVLPTQTAQPTRTPAPTVTSIPELTNTSSATSASTSTPTRTPEPTREPTTAPTVTRKPAPTPARSSTPVVVPDVWFWRGHGSFNAENGVLGIVNYTNKVLTVRVEGVGVFEVPANTGSVLALELVPQVYMVYARVPDAAEASMAPYTWCTGMDSLRVTATRALVLAIRQHMPEWGNRVALADCPFYEDPDKP